MDHEIETGARIDERGCLSIVIKQSQVGLRFWPWDEGLSVEHIEEGRWVRGDVNEDAPLLDWAECDSTVAAFVVGIPENIRRRVSWFGYTQLPVLRLLCKEPEAESLLDDNPLLLLLLAGTLSVSDRAWSHARRFVLGPRTEILALTTGVRSQAAVRLLTRLRFTRVGAADLNSIHKLLKQPELVRALTPLPSVRGELLSPLLARPELLRFKVTLRLLDGTATDRDPYGALYTVIRTMGDLDRMARDLGHADPSAAYRACTTTTAVTRLHDRWIDRLRLLSIPEQALSLERYYETSLLPSPPVAGNDSIVPLRTLEELLTEGREMRHCVGSYHVKVMFGESAIYAVLAPERATLEVAMRLSGPVVLHLLLFDNGEPSEATRRAVQEWLDASSEKGRIPTAQLELRYPKSKSATGSSSEDCENLGRRPSAQTLDNGEPAKPAEAGQPSCSSATRRSARSKLALSISGNTTAE